MVTPEPNTDSRPPFEEPSFAVGTAVDVGAGAEAGLAIVGIGVACGVMTGATLGLSPLPSGVVV
jgi:hypothetical protein